MTQPTSSQPQLLLIEDNPLDAQLARILLKGVGFQVTHASSVLEGETCAVAMLAAEAPGSLVILLDIQMPDVSHPELASPLLAAALCGRMQRQEIRPAHMVALTSHITGAIEEEALFAGCSHVLGKPLTNQHSSWLRQMADEEVRLPRVDQGRRLYQQKAEEILRLVRRATISNAWVEEDIHLVLSAVTSYPTPKSLDEPRQAALVLKLGGTSMVREHLKQCAEQLAEPHKSILQAYLSGKQQRQLASMFPHYDRTTIYRHSQGLLKRICDCFMNSL